MVDDIEPSNATVQCNLGYVPTAATDSTCENGMWIPDIENYMCEEMIGKVLLNNTSGALF